MNEIFDDNMLNKAEGLRKALAKREGRLPKLSPDVNARLMSQMNQAKPTRPSVRLFWRWSVAASIAILVLSVAVWSYFQNDKPATSSMISADMKPHKQAVLNEKSHAESEVILPEISERIFPQVQTKETVKMETQENEVEKNEEEINKEERIEEDRDAADGKAMELTADQKNMANYIAGLTQTCQADSMPIDCGNIDRSMVYVFPEKYVLPDKKEVDVLEKLNMVVLWLDADKPSVRMAFSSGQMTLELDGDNKANSVNEIWLADKRDGLVYLYHTQSRIEEQNWASTSCYMNFLAENKPGRKAKYIN